MKIEDQLEDCLKHQVICITFFELSISKNATHFASIVILALLTFFRLALWLYPITVW